MIEGTGTETTAAATATDSGTVATPTNADFNASLGESLQSNESLYAFENVDGLANEYIQQGTKMGEIQTQLDEAIAKVPVVPGSAGEYEVTLPEGVDSAVMDGFKEMALTEGLSSKQVQAVVNFDNQRTEATLKATNAKNAETRETFKKEWGANYDANLTLVNRAAVQFGGEEFATALQETGLAYHPGLINGFLKAGKAMAEDAMHTSNTMTTTQNRPMGVDGQPMLKFNM